MNTRSVTSFLYVISIQDLISNISPIPYCIKNTNLVSEASYQFERQIVASEEL